MFGTDEAFCRCKEHQLPTTAGSDLTGHGEVHICVDDQSIVYVNGENIGETTVAQWQSTEMFAFDASCSSPTTVRARPGRLCPLTVLRSKSALYGAFCMGPRVA